MYSVELENTPRTCTATHAPDITDHNLITQSQSQSTNSFMTFITSRQSQKQNPVNNNNNLNPPTRLLQLPQHPINTLPRPRQIPIHRPIGMPRLEFMMQVDEFLCALKIIVACPPLFLLGC